MLPLSIITVEYYYELSGVLVILLLSIIMKVIKIHPKKSILIFSYFNLQKCILL